MCVYMARCLGLYMSVCVFVWLVISCLLGRCYLSPLILFQSLYICIYLSFYAALRSSSSTAFIVSVCVSVCVSVRVFVYLLACLSVCLSVWPVPVDSACRSIFYLVLHYLSTLF